MSIFRKDISKGAYQGRLTCPFSYYDGDVKTCGSTAIRYVEHVTPTRLRYRCRKCGRTFQYDISNQIGVNPYAAYRKGKIWNDIKRVASWGV